LKSNVNFFIKEIINEEMAGVQKLRKSELIEMVGYLMERNLRELSNESIIDIYEETFNTFVRSAR